MKESFSEWKEKIIIYAKKLWLIDGERLISKINDKKLMGYYNKNYTIFQVLCEEIKIYDKS